MFKIFNLISNSNMYKIASFFLIVALCACAGCSDKQPLGGKVTFSDDGTPLTTGAVFLETPTFQSSGSIQADGTYVVGSAGLDDGIPQGTYRVSIRGADSITTVDGPEGSPTEKRASLIDPKYQSPDTSGLTFTVDGSTKRFDIQVDRAK